MSSDLKIVIVLVNILNILNTTTSAMEIVNNIINLVRHLPVDFMNNSLGVGCRSADINLIKHSRFFKFTEEFGDNQKLFALFSNYTQSFTQISHDMDILTGISFPEIREGQLVKFIITDGFFPDRDIVWEFRACKDKVYLPYKDIMPILMYLCSWSNIGCEIYNADGSKDVFQRYKVFGVRFDIKGSVFKILREQLSRSLTKVICCLGRESLCYENGCVAKSDINYWEDGEREDGERDRIFILDFRVNWALRVLKRFVIGCIMKERTRNWKDEVMTELEYMPGGSGAVAAVDRLYIAAGKL